MSIVPRNHYLAEVRESLLRYPVTVILGSRQVGKSTLAKVLAQSPENHFDLDNTHDLNRLSHDSYGLLSSLRGVVVLDEIQQMPELFREMKAIVDEPLCQTKFLLTGSASPKLVYGASESLAGRVNFIELCGFDLEEVPGQDLERLWFRGGYPLAYLAKDDSAVDAWLRNYLQTWVIRDIRYFAGGELPPRKLANFLLLLAHYHGQSWNQHKAAQTLGLDIKTVQRYLEVFEGSYLIRILDPFDKNVGKRLHKSPRIYIRDSGLYHHLLKIRSFSQLQRGDHFGASWEGFALEQVIRLTGGNQDPFFWRTHAGAEIDLVFPHRENPVGFEFKASKSPKVSKGSTEAVKDLGISKLYVVHPGSNSDAISNNIQTLPITSLSDVGSLLF